MTKHSALTAPLRRTPDSYRRLAATWLLCVACGTAGAAAPTQDTLGRIAESGVLRLGVRQSSTPFSSIPRGSERAVGYSIDLCERVAGAIRRQLHLPALRIEHVAVTPADRMERLENGDIDLECGSTTNTRERQERVAFSYTTFVTGARLLVRRDAGIRQLRDLAGKSVVTTRGTSTETLLKREAEIGWMRGVALLSADDHPQAFRMLAEGKAEAFAMDEILLTAMLTKAERPDDFFILGKYISIEPYALMFRKGDSAFAAAVNDTLRGLMESGEIHRLYAKWFMTPAFDFPPTQLIRESLASPDSTPAFP